MWCTKRALRLSFDYIDTPERRVLSLAADGVACVPVLGFDAYRRQWRAAPIHVYEECLEISLCLRGDLEFELGGERYPFRPGTVFVSRPDEPHRLRAYPKGMSKYWILFRIPARGERILGLSAKETAWPVQELTHLPQRLFAGTKEIRTLFKRLFALYDDRRCPPVERKVRIRAAVTELLLALVEAAHRNAPACLSRLLPHRPREGVAGCGRQDCGGRGGGGRLCHAAAFREPLQARHGPYAARMAGKVRKIANTISRTTFCRTCGIITSTLPRAYPGAEPPAVSRQARN